MYLIKVETAIVLLLIATVTVLAQGLNENSTIPASFSLLLITGLILNKQSKTRTIFVTSFCLCVFCSIVFYNYYLLTPGKYTSLTGSPFIGGGDDELFYNRSVEAFNNGFSFVDLNIIQFRFWFFIYVNFLYIELLDFFIIWDYHLLHLIFFSSFLGSFVPVFVYRISERVFDIQVANTAAMVTMFFPYLIFNNATFLREVYVSFLLYFTLFLTYNRFYYQNIANIFSLILGIFSTIGIRIETGIPNILVSVQSSTSKNFIRRLISLVLLIGASYYFYDVLFSRKSGLESSYNDMLMDVSISEKGIGASLAAHKDDPIGIVVYSFLSVFNPVPPVPNFNRLDDWFNGIGFIGWYFIIPVAFMGIYRYEKDRNFKISSIIIIIMFIFISFKMQGGIRHRLPMMPIVFMFYSYAIHNISKNMIKKINLIVLNLLILMIFIYFIMQQFNQFLSLIF